MLNTLVPVHLLKIHTYSALTWKRGFSTLVQPDEDPDPYGSIWTTNITSITFPHGGQKVLFLWNTAAEFHEISRNKNKNFAEISSTTLNVNCFQAFFL
jgi:hypothetical protein